MAPSNLGVVISAGGWHTPPLYAKFIEALAEHGIEAHCPLIPTLTVTDHDVRDEQSEVFDMPEPAGGWPTVYDDAKTIQDAIDSLIHKGKNVVIIGHSMGGFAATQAASPEYYATSRAAKGFAGGIVGVFYYGAFLLPVGMSVNDMVGSDIIPPYTTLHKQGKAGLSTPIRLREFFLARVSDEDAAFYGGQMRAQPIPVQKLTTDPFKDLPTAYVICKDDLALPPEAQERMCAAKLSGGSKLTVFRESFDHSPQISATRTLVQLLLEFSSSI